MAFTACMSYNSFVLRYLLLLYVPCIDFRLPFLTLFICYIMFYTKCEFIAGATL